MYSWVLCAALWFGGLVALNSGPVVHRVQQMPRQRLGTDEQKMSVKLNRQRPTTLPCDRMMAPKQPLLTPPKPAGKTQDSWLQNQL